MSNVDASIIAALPANAVVSYDWNGERYFWAKEDDGRFHGTYYVGDIRCANGYLDAASIARYITDPANTNVTIVLDSEAV